MNCCTVSASNALLKNENIYSYQIQSNNNDMESTARPTVDVDNLNVNKRPWPDCKYVNYDDGTRFSFRPGKLEFQLWKWPWPEWIGLPSRETLDEWFELINDWKRCYKGTYNNDHVEKCIKCMLPYL